MKKNKKGHYSGIGGQAVLEGVMMRNKDDYAVAIRKPNGEIEVEVDVFRGCLAGSKLTKIPFIRGVFNFIDSLRLGMKTLNYSASFYEDEEAGETKLDKALDKVSGGKGEKVLMGITTLISVALAVGIFILLPYFLSSLLSEYVRNTSLLTIIEGGIRIAIFLIYIAGISLMKDIHRLYQYHGAEHKCINCIENGMELTVENAKKQTMVHKRCGTSFMLVVMFVSILLFMFISVPNMWVRMVLRILLIPVIAGISFEFISLAGKSENPVINVLSKPGLWLQALTTREPDDSMLEVAISSVEAVFDWRDFLAHYEDEEEQPEEEGFEVVDVEDENDEILQALDRYFDEAAPTEEKEQ